MPNTDTSAPRVPPRSVRTRDSINRKLRDYAADPAKYAGTADVADPAPPKETPNGNDDD